ncbi:ATP-binding protein [Streptomyces sp. NPDC126514]|uniref:ATP-binding protein n=1 Tax=Streptomyces sp. NPDC126514 TaxID=3155210 RepID=UPI00332BDAD1
MESARQTDHQGFSEVIAMYVTRFDTSGTLCQPTRLTRTASASASASAEAGVSAGGRAGTVTCDLEHAPQSVSRARHLAEEFLGDCRSDGAGTVVLVVSELVTNAIEHAQPPVVLHLHRESTSDRVWVGVTDGGLADGEGAWTSSCSDAEHGRGLGIVGTLADTHGTRRLSNGNATHWARLRAA